MKYLLIDGNNLGIRSAFANSELKNKDDIPTGAHYGVFNSLISLKEKFPDYQILFAWDGKSKRRITEASAGVNAGIIKSGYKENRKKDDQPKPLIDFYTQLPYLKKGIDQTGIPQIQYPEYETDDVIASYCKLLRSDNEVVCVTSDFDYLQLLDDNVSIYDGMKQLLTTKKNWEEENGITPDQYIDVGALEGDSGDNIFGVYGVGEKTAMELIKEHKTYKNMYDNLHKLYEPLRQQYLDLKQEDFIRLQNIKTKSDKPKYPEIDVNMPYTGVTLAVEDKKIKDIKKSILMVLMFEKRVDLAYSLKKMDCDIPDLPPIINKPVNKDRLKEYFSYFDMESLVARLDLFL